MKKKNLVLTYSNNQTELTSLTYPFLERYCENHNLDLLILRENSQKIINKFKSDEAEWFYSCDRWYAYDLFHLYERILWIGSDVLVQPYAPNIFDVVPKGQIGVFIDQHEGKGHHAGDLIGDCFNAFGVRPNGYYNIDVMLVDNTEKEIFNYNKTDMKVNHQGKWTNQDYFNYYTTVNNVPIFDIGYRWNCMVSNYLYTGRPIPEDWYFMHVTGIPAESRIQLIQDYLTRKGMI